MSSIRLYQLCGIALLIGGILAAVGQIQNFSVASSSIWVVTGLLMLAGNMLEFLGLSAIPIKQAQQAGWLGIIGFLLFFLSGLILGVAFPFLTLIMTPWMASIPALSHSSGPPALTPVLLAVAAVNLVGTLVFAIAILRAHVFPRWPAIVLIVCILLNFAGNPLGFDQLSTIALAVLHLAIAWFGFILCFRSTDVQEIASSPLPASNTGIGV